MPASLRVSADCMNLLEQMLKADPADRITLGRIREHPWFLTSLPIELQARHGHLPVCSAELIRVGLRRYARERFIWFHSCLVVKFARGLILFLLSEEMCTSQRPLSGSWYLPH